MVAERTVKLEESRQQLRKRKKWKPSDASPEVSRTTSITSSP